MKKFNFQNLEVYQISKELAVDNYKITDKFPDKERFALVQQMNRAAVSIPSNIAEGSGRVSSKDQSHFITMAYGSLMELTCQYEIAKDLGYITQDQFDIYLKKAKNLSVKLSNFKRAIREQ